jgi:VanZ family protein
MKWLAISFFLFIVVVIVLADLGTLSHYLGGFNKLPYGDKAGHFLLYGILNLLIDLSLFRSLPTRNPRLVAVICGLFLALAIGLEEFSQQYFTNRSFDLIDLAFSYLGVIFFSWLALRINK